VGAIRNDMDIGRRIRELREARRINPKAMGFNRATLSRVETGEYAASIGWLEHACDRFGIGIKRLVSSDEDFAAMLALEDPFALEVLPFLKLLSAEQRAYILKVLDAAPKQKPRPFANIENRTSSGSRNSTAGRDSISTSPT
jgi:transcriptional regulator with XRE-family HTH domain